MIKKGNKIIGFKIGVLSGVFIDEENFCLDCFLKFFIKSNSDLNILKYIKDNILIYGENILYSDFPVITDSLIYLKNELTQKTLNLDMTFHRHPHCSKHSDTFFINTKDIYKKAKNIRKKLDISTYSIELDKEIFGLCGIIKYIDFNNTATALSHNPLSYLYNNEDLFFICSGYKKGIDTKTISTRVAIMEGLERFAGFSYCNKSFVLKSKLQDNTYLNIEYVNLNTFIPVFNNKNLTNNGKYVLTVYDILSDKEFYIDSNLLLIDSSISKNIINSTGGSAHFNYNLSILNGVSELIERDSLMKMWLYRYTPNKYDISVILQENKSIFNEMSEFFDISLYKIKSLSGFTTLAFGKNKKQKFVKPLFIYGSSNSFSENDSIDGAISELYITFNNLSKYDFKNIDKKQVNSVMDHYYYYQDIDRFKTLSFIFENNKVLYNTDIDRNILCGNKDFNKIISNLPFKFYIFNLTPKFLFKKGIYITKVISEDLQPMDFGYYNLKLSSKIKLSDISKESLLEPHPFF